MTDDIQISSPRRKAIRDLVDRHAPMRNGFIDRNCSFHDSDHRFMRFLVPEGGRVLEVGCGTGRLLAALRPSRGVGIDISGRMIEIARADHPGLEFIHGDVEDPATLAGLDGPFDTIVLSDTIGFLDDCQTTLAALKPLMGPDTRIVIAYYNYLWGGLLKLAERLGLRMPTPELNWLRTPDIENLLFLTGFEPIRSDWRQLIPYRLLGLGTLINRFIGTLPLVRLLCLRNYIVARAPGLEPPRPLSTTVVVPCRNERGNVEPIARRIPRFCEDLEILFVEGHSADGTFAEIERVIAAMPERDMKALRQDGRGKGDAVRKGFDQARGDILMILDADMTVPPEDLPKFYEAIVSGKGEFINGSRLVYPMEKDAMRFLNRIANHAFSYLFTWLLNQRHTDTLCGTKVLRRHHYRTIADNRHYFGDFDPFGDFDLLFGAAKANLKVIEIPVRYQARTFGETQISRFRHGLLLLRMARVAYTKLKGI
ncbi:MAG: bifunctional class I SAM-dependent methyltransferase/glycosyltransferase family 2 protein [Alphaproteobacteria bacterium]